MNKDTILKGLFFGVILMLYGHYKYQEGFKISQAEMATKTCLHRQTVTNFDSKEEGFETIHMVMCFE